MFEYNRQEGDWHRKDFGANRFLIATHFAVVYLKSYREDR